jgi:hypothetical protein
MRIATLLQLRIRGNSLFATCPCRLRTAWMGRSRSVFSGNNRQANTGDCDTALRSGRRSNCTDGRQGILLYSGVCRTCHEAEDVEHGVRGAGGTAADFPRGMGGGLGDNCVITGETMQQ